MGSIHLLLAIASVILLASEASGTNCSDVYFACKNNTLCSSLYNTYTKNCQDVLVDNRLDRCTPECLESWNNVSTNNIGSDFLNCNCQADASCADSGHRLFLACFNATCQRTEATCRAEDTGSASDCKSLIDDYRSKCQTLIDGTTKNCSADCKNSFEALSANPLGTLSMCACGKDPGCHREGSAVSYYCFGEVWNSIPELCDDVIAGCRSNAECNKTMEVYLHACYLPSDNPPTACPSAACRDASLMLLRHPISARMTNCACRDQRCTVYQRATYFCAQSFQEKFFCSDVGRECVNGTNYNTTCGSLLTTHRSRCSSSYGGRGNCTHDCRYSLMTLFSDPIGKKFDNCQCRDDEITCQVESINFAHSCYDIAPSYGNRTCDYLKEVPNPSNEYCTDVVARCRADKTCNNTFYQFYHQSACPEASEGHCSASCESFILNYLCHPIIAASPGCICPGNATECFTHRYDFAQNAKSCLPEDQRIALKSSQLCQNVGQACNSSNNGCKTLLRNYLEKCAALLSGTATNCSRECLASFEALSANPIGAFFPNCHCGNNDIPCHLHGPLISFHCHGEIWQSRERCDDIIGACWHQTKCNDTVQAYLKACDPAKGTDECPSGCEDLAETVVKHPVLGRLVNCVCRDDDDKCPKYKTITDLCVDDKPPTDLEAAFAEWRMKFDEWQREFQKWQKEECSAD